MTEVTRPLADQIADIARLLDDDSDSDLTLRRLTRMAVELVPGGTAAALTVEAERRALTFAVSDPRIGELHELQFDAAQGPAVEVLRRNEPRRVDDIRAERRWPVFCRAAARAGFGSCLMLPLRTDRRPAGAVSLYGREPDAFRGASHDLAVLFAAQGGTAVHNAALYRTCREMVDNLHTALGSRAIIEQAKGILHATLGVSPDEAFGLLNRSSHATNRTVRAIAADLVHGQIHPRQLPRRTDPPASTRLL
ncbi:MAG: GAF and ANTAR domain-containing protein [Streptosporangiaceae bacterium]